MSTLYRQLIRPLLFAQESEAIHERTLNGLGFIARHRLLTEGLAALFEAPALPVELFGLRFPNPLGLAAGMDKQAGAVPVGFGFTELGGVTLHEQPGNPSPRMFRAAADEALVNRMGFNNPGAEAMAVRLAAWKQSGLWPRHPVGMNLGKSKVTPLERAAEDYVGSFKLLREHVDFFVVNVSSPNTPNLRQLQDKSALDEILAALQEANAATHESRNAHPRQDRARPLLHRSRRDSGTRRPAPAGRDCRDQHHHLAPGNERRPCPARVCRNRWPQRPSAASTLDRVHPPPLPPDGGPAADYRRGRHFQCGRCLGENHRRSQSRADLYRPRL
jgi:hypothetical protein